MPQVEMYARDEIAIKFGFKPADIPENKDLKLLFDSREVFLRSAHDLVEYAILANHVKKGFLYLIKFEPTSTIYNPTTPYFTVVLTYSPQIIKDWIDELMKKTKSRQKEQYPQFQRITAKRIKGFELEDI
jgi:hypothetical protein